VFQYNQGYNDSGLQDLANQYQLAQYGTRLFSNGSFMPLGISYVQETTIFREYGPLAGNTVRVGYEFAPSIGSLLSRHTADADARYYLRLATNGVLAFRARGFKSWGEFPGYMYFGGNSELRGYDYLEFLGNKAFFLDAELRFPLIEAALTPLGVIGGLRGIAFANLGGAGYEGLPMQVWSRKPITVRPLLGFQPNFSTLTYDPIYGTPTAINGFKLVDGRASYGIGLETFALGFPIHFDWSWRTLLNTQYEDYVFAYQGIQQGMTGSKWFRKPRFSMWIGYDF
jgi:outer membrane protein assembly factor BamA